MAANDFSAYNSLPPLNYDALFSGGSLVANVLLLGYVEGFCNPKETSGAVLEKPSQKFAVLRLVGVITNYNFQAPDSPTAIRTRTSGRVLIVAPDWIVNSFSMNNRPFIAVGPRISKNKRNTNLLQSFKFEKDAAGMWVCCPNYTYNLGNAKNAAQFSEYMPVLETLKKNGYPKGWKLKSPANYVGASEGVDLLCEVGQVDKNGMYVTQKNPYPDPPVTLGKATASTNSSWGNRSENREGALTKSRIKSRNSLEPISKYAAPLHDEVEGADKKVSALLDEYLNVNYSGDTILTAIQNAAKKMKAHWNVSNAGIIRGRDLLEKAVAKLEPSYIEKGSQGSAYDILESREGSNILDIWAYMDESDIDDYGTNDLVSRLQTDLCRKRVEIYYAILEVIFKIKGLHDVAFIVEDMGYDMYALLHINPYALCLLDNRIPIKGLDFMSILYKVDRSDEKIMTLRNVAYVHYEMLNDDFKGFNKDSHTVFNRNSIIADLPMSYDLGLNVSSAIKEHSCILEPKLFNTLHTYIDSSFAPIDLCFMDNELIQGTDKSGRSLAVSITGKKPTYEEKQKAVDDYVNSGLGVKIEVDGVECISDFIFAKKEDYIYAKLYDMASCKAEPVDKDDLEKCILDFEKQKEKDGIAGFKLEPLQADAIRLVEQPVVCLTGPAGSGKTTTVEGIIHAMQTLYGLEDDEILFCAPTGKAANRLKEVVKRPTGTIHSKFRICGDDMSLRQASEEHFDGLDNVKALIIDECSMITVDLMYNMLRKVPDKTRMYFLGDVEQLPPIGFGKPFANMLTFLPTVRLEVSKRASEKSKINANAKAIINNSELSEFAELKNGEDFKMIHITDSEEAVSCVENLVTIHLGKKEMTLPHNIAFLKNMSPDDIQVVTPYSSTAKLTSTFHLNNRLQNIFNPRKSNQNVCKIPRGTSYSESGEKITNLIEFRLGDRVINTKNDIDKPRLYRDDLGVWRKVTPVSGQQFKGIMNGDVGKIVGFYYASDLEFGDMELAKIYDGTDKTLFVAVKFADMDTTGEMLDFVCLFRTTERSISSDNEIFVDNSYDVSLLDLAYALTVHKLQGSQAQLIIFIMSEGNATFVCRNLIYTAITRAQKGCYIVGDVEPTGNRASLLTRGRRVEQAGSRISLLDKIC